MTLSFKKDDSFDKINYQTLSLLSHMSTVFRKNNSKTDKRIYSTILSSLLTGFHKTHNTQHPKGKFADTIFMDLSKASKPRPTNSKI